MEFPYLPEEEIETAAANLRSEAFGASEATPLPVDLETITYDYLYDQKGVGFRNDRELGSREGERVLGITRPRQRKIFVDAELRAEGPQGRYRFTVAHEIGHWILHQPLYSRDEEQGDLFKNAHEKQDQLISLQRNVFPKANRGQVPPEEWQANRFAVALLIDQERLREEFRARFSTAYVTPGDLDRSPTASGRRRAARSLARKAVGELTPLAELFGLSTQSMAIALEKRGYVRREQTAL